MSYGITVNNLVDGLPKLVIDETHSQPKTIMQGTFPASSGYQLNLYDYNGGSPIGAQVPLLFFRPAIGVIFQLDYIGQDYANCWSSGGTTEFKLFDAQPRTDLQSIGTHGMRVYGSTGGLLFDSTRPPPRILSRFVVADGSPAERSNLIGTGVFVVRSVPVSLYADDGGLPFISAVGMGNTWFRPSYPSGIKYSVGFRYVSNTELQVLAISNGAGHHPSNDYTTGLKPRYGVLIK